mmetsp:Transcript_41986/g.96412  ORF Transcript_41986/g.96412 Transcript_41986/m.96412 type:complete len:706 (+) Transcript_41986:57-2174(+)
MVGWEEQIKVRKRAEWNDKYVDYRSLKRKLEKIIDKKGAATVPKLAARGTVDIGAYVGEDGSLSSPLVGGVKEEIQDMIAEFLQDVDEELDRVSKFYDSKATQLERTTQKVAQASTDGAYQLSSGISTADIHQLYNEAQDLTDYVHVNAEALRKIVKKMDKRLNVSEQKSFVKNKLQESALATVTKVAKPCDGERARSCRRKLEGVVSLELLEDLRQKRQQELMVRKNLGHEPNRLRLKPSKVLLSLVVAALAAVAAPKAATLQGHSQEQRCIVLLAFIVTMWVSEAAPYEATALLVPPLGVSLRILDGTVQQQADRLIGAVFTDSLYLVLCGFVISSIFSRCQLDCKAAAFLQRKLGDSPYLFMLAIMFLGVGLSALVSNVTAPIMLLQVLRPSLCDLPSDLAYSKALLLGLAFACNVGGMMTPISSPQNVVSLQTLRSAGGSITWAEWLSMSIPYCTLAVLSAWGIILLVIARPFSADQKLDKIPVVVYEKKDLAMFDAVSLLGASLTLFGFAYAPVADALGGTAMLALTFVAIALGTGSITKETFNGYNWSMLFLIGGGNSLGLVVRESGLLDIITNLAREYFSQNPFTLIAELVAVLVVATTFVSHTVAALVLMPLVVELGSEANITTLSVLVGALGCSTACALPMTSFPNINSLQAVDNNEQHWLGSKHFLMAGIPTTVTFALMLATVGPWLGGFVLAEL